MPVQDEVPKTRLTLTYKTEVNGAPGTVDLPFRLLVMGDFSDGSSKDRSVDLEERRIRSFNGSNSNEILKDMEIELNLEVKNKITPQIEDNLKIKLSIDKLNSFNPEEIAKKVPQIQSLLLIKELLKELQSTAANRKEFNTLLKKLYSQKVSFQQLKEKLKEFAVYQIPQKKGPSENKGDNQ